MSIPTLQRCHCYALELFRFIPQRQNGAASSENEGICTPWTTSALSRDGLPLPILLDEYSLHQPSISHILQGICKLARSSRTGKQHSLSSKCPHNIQKVGNPISKHLYPYSPEACISQQAGDNDSPHRLSSRAELKGRQLISSKIPLFVSWRLLILSPKGLRETTNPSYILGYLTQFSCLAAKAFGDTLICE